MLSGATPFKGDTASDLIVSILERDPTPLVTTRLLPSELDWIVRKALRKDREERYQTARELLGDLRGLKQQLDFAAQVERSATPDPRIAIPSHQGAGSIAQMHDVTTDEPRAIPTAQSQRATTGIQPAAASTRRMQTFAIAAGLAVLLTLAGLAIYRFWPSHKIAFQSMKITPLTNSGNAIDAMLSPDGKYVVYALSEAGMQSLWIRQVSTANDRQIVPPARVGFFGLTFSPDGNDLYYVNKQSLDAGILYRVPTLGGTPRKILERIDAPFSFSPDGKQLVLVRGNYPNQGESALVIANADGGSERVLAVRKAPEFFAPIFYTGPSWSPDGKLIAAAVARVGASSHVLAFAVTDGKETDLTPTPWPFAARVQWLPDMSGLLVIAGEAPGASQVWFLSYPDGARRQITNDLNSYRAIGLPSDASKFSTVQSSGLVNIWIAPDGDAKRASTDCPPATSAGPFQVGTSWHGRLTVASFWFPMKAAIWTFG